MTRTLPALSLAAVLAAWLLVAGPARAVFPPPIKDDGKFFTKEGLEKANKKIRDIYQKYKKDVVVETIAELTDEQKKKLKDDKEKKFFGSLAHSRIEELGVNGIYVIISKNPRFLQMDMDTDTRKKTFTNTDRKVAQEKFFAAFREMKFDAGLLDALDAIEAALKAHSK
jgi:uncharacterized membrane protein YgcG